jgi:hypothetical protein
MKVAAKAIAAITSVFVFIHTQTEPSTRKRRYEKNKETFLENRETLTNSNLQRLCSRCMYLLQ